jgi:hypothetical protein
LANRRPKAPGSIGERRFVTAFVFEFVFPAPPRPKVVAPSVRT